MDSHLYQQPQLRQLDVGKLTGEEDGYYRLEVYDLTGSRGYDVYGYSENQLINNVLDLYERHLAFLYMQQTQPGDSDVSDGAEPEPTWQEDS